MSVVVDASVALSWILPGEGAVLCLSLRDSAAANPEIRLFVPPNFWYEVANTLWVAACRERLTQATATAALDTLVEFQFTVWPVEPAVCLALSFQQGLAVYDSAYLSLALEHSSTLWTLDQTLAKTAGELNVVVKPTF